jgi:hypothetical protein
MVWFETTGNGYAEWTSVNPATQERSLVNAANVAGAIKAYVSLATPTIAIESAASLSASFAADNTATINETARTITMPTAGPARYYRLRYLGSMTPPVAVKITSTTVTPTQVTLGYTVN